MKELYEKEVDTMISDYEIKECYKEDTVGRKYHNTIVTKSAPNTKGDNSEVRLTNLDKPMRYDEFKRLSHELQAMYITRLKHKYNVSQGDLADMLNVTGSTMYNRCKLLGVDHLFNKSRMTKEQAVAWNEFLNALPQADSKSDDKAMWSGDFHVNNLTFDVEGIFNSEDMLNIIKRYIDDGIQCKMYVAITNIGGDKPCVS